MIWFLETLQSDSLLACEGWTVVARVAMGQRMPQQPGSRCDISGDSKCRLDSGYVLEGSTLLSLLLVQCRRTL